MLENGSAYMVWIGVMGQITSIQKNELSKKFQLVPDRILFLNTAEDSTTFLANLKPVAHVCFDASRHYYRQLCDKYKSRMTSAMFISKFMQPWMQNIYYNFKLAFVEELMGEFETALKYYHSILAKYKQMIEDSRENSELTSQIFNYLRFSSDVCFLKVHSLL